MGGFTAFIKKRYPKSAYLLECQRCFSVWAGLTATLTFVVFPWLNWPLALSWLYIWHNEVVFQRRVAMQGREFRVTLNKEGNFQVKSDLTSQEISQVMAMVAPNIMKTANGAVSSGSN